LPAEPHPSTHPGSRQAPRFTLLKRALLSAATAFLAIMLWTGAPLFSLWVGSRVQAGNQLTIQAVFIVVLVLSLLVAVLTVALIKLNAAYDRLAGRPAREQRFTWLRSMRAEGKDESDRAVGTTILEGIVMASVWVAVIALLLWFFLLAGSPLPH
jgi:hypothetical protein